METGLDVNCEKTNCVVISRDQNAGRSHSTKTDNIPFQRVEGFRYLGATLTHQTSIKEEIKSRLKSRNAFYHLVQYILFSRLLSKNINIKIHRIIILPPFLYGCESWSLTLKDEGRLRVFENRMLRRVFAPHQTLFG
jgi:hypothetical protein